MRRIQRIRRPSAVLAQCLYASSSTSAPLRRATAGTSSFLFSRPRDFSTTPASTFKASRAWALGKEKSAETPPELTSESPAAATSELQSQTPETATEPEPEPEPTMVGPDTQLFEHIANQEKTVPESAADPSSEIIATSVPKSVPSSRQKTTSYPASPPPSTRMSGRHLRLPPQHRTTAPRADELDEADDYEPAQSAAALPVLGGLGQWFEKPRRARRRTVDAPAPARDNWLAAGRAAAGFTQAARPVAGAAVLELCVHRAVLEALAVRAAGPGAEALLVAGWRASGGWDRALGLGVRFDEEGKEELVGDWRGVVEGLMGGVGPRETMKSAAEAKAILQNLPWEVKRVSLEDPKLKFAIAKRIYQLTGHAIPDAKVFGITSVGDLLATLVKPPPRRRVHEAVQRRGELAKLPNVQVYARRQTPVHKAKALGRWKVVKRELVKRDLPVLGTDAGAVDRYREADWFRGPQPAVKDNKKGRRKHHR